MMYARRLQGSERPAWRAGLWALTLTPTLLHAAEKPVIDAEAAAAFTSRCLTCHSTAKHEGDLDLERPLASLAAAAATDPGVWERVLENIETGEMPPKEAAPLAAAEKTAIQGFVRTTLDAIAVRTAGDPGPVSLRRLSPMEYTYTVRDLTGVDTLDPLRGLRAQQQGSTNQAAAQGGMSEALLGKYLEAAGEVATHAMLVSDGVVFSTASTQQDQVDDLLVQIRRIYARHSADGGGSAVDLQGIKFTTSAGGRLPLESYLAAVQGGDATGLSPKYLAILRRTLSGTSQSPVLAPLQAKFREGKLTPADVARWQEAVWRFTTVGHIGKAGGPKAWQEPVNPIVTRQEFNVPLPPPGDKPDAGDVTLRLCVTDAGDGTTGDVAVWEKPRLVIPGRGEIPLRDIRHLVERQPQRRAEFARLLPACLTAAHETKVARSPRSTAELAAAHGVREPLLVGCLNLLGGGSGEPVVGVPLTARVDGLPTAPAVKGWSGKDALSVIANPTGADIRHNGIVFPAHGIVAHPAPTVAVGLSWRSPVAGALRIEGDIRDVDTGGGNGVAWSVQVVSRGRALRELAAGVTKGGDPVRFGPFAGVDVTKGDAVTVVIDAHQGNHGWDSTAVTLRIEAGMRTWDLAKDVAADIVAGNPHADSHGNAAVWHFVGGPSHLADSLLTAWQQAREPAERARLATRIADLVAGPGSDLPADAPDAKLRGMLLELADSLPESAFDAAGQAPPAGGSRPGIDAAAFGRRPDGSAIDASWLCVAAPSTIELRLPREFVAKDAKFVATGRLLDPASAGSVQMQVLTHAAPVAAGLLPSATRSESVSGRWSDNNQRSSFGLPVIVGDAPATRQRFEAVFDEFRQVFPVALCYPKIVPVDEVVTLSLFYREDDHLVRLMLDDAERAELDRLWDALLFVGEVPLAQIDALEQLIQFATQDANPKPFMVLREPYRRQADEFLARRTAAEPRHVQAVVALADRAWRRPLAAAERAGIESLYATLRGEGLGHPDAIRMLIARVLTAPEFLYRGERPAAGAAAVSVNDWELATRLSYFLWSSLPDDALRSQAAAGKLRDPAVLAAEARRMLADPKVRRLGAEFGCEYLHVADVATLDEKSETAFPTFKQVRADMQEEVARFFTDLFQADRSVLSLLDADHTFVNGPLAQHYALTGIDPKRADWTRVEGMKGRGRGGALGFAATLARQAGASRTSPILRGTWIWEVVLGQKLPKPPQGVPQLPEETPAGLTERQLTERHSSDEKCASCHRRIDPFGYALEGFDAIGRTRQKDAAGLPIDTATALADGTKLAGLDGLRQHLLAERRDDVVRQFCRKLLMYALGRPLLISDKPLVDTLVRDLGSNDHRVGVAIDTIVRSPHFRQVRGREYEPIR
jgi:hypothetical protein